MDFESIGLRPELVACLKKQEITACIGIQEAMISSLLAGKDIIACAQTGSGKTLGYLLPVFQRQDQVENGLQVVILVPTHELGLQVQRQILLLAEGSGIALRSAAVFGDANVELQIKKLKTKPQIVVGTPGRVLDLMNKRHIPAHLAKTIVVDEGDLLFDRNNAATVSAILKKTMRDTQLAVVSASLSKDTQGVIEAIGRQPELLTQEQAPRIPSGITHIRVDCEERDKPECLRKLMAALKPDRAMAFVNNRDLLERVSEKLKYHKLSADFIHGESTQQDRKRIMDQFRSGSLTLLLSTDLAARGLSFDDIDVVFCLTASEHPNEYLHRAGRTGRCGKPGVCVSLMSEKEVALYASCEKQFGFQLRRMRLREGQLMDQNQRIPTPKV